jgi:hypothetical protein
MDVTALPPYRNLILRFWAQRGVTKERDYKCITAEGENPDNSNEEIPQSPTWLLLQNGGSTKPWRSESSFSS